MKETRDSSIQAGSPAPDFCLPSTEGRKICLSDYRGKSQVLLFFVREFV